MPRALLLLWCGLAAVCSQGPDGILYSSLGESVLLPCGVKSRPTPPPSPPGGRLPLPQPEPDQQPTQWHFLAPSGEMHPLAAWHPRGKVYKPGGDGRQSQVEMFPNASLQVQQLQLRDAGRYVCFQSDLQGNTSFLQNVTLIITGPDVAWPPSATYRLHLLLGFLLGAKILLLVLFISCLVSLSLKKHNKTYVNVSE